MEPTEIEITLNGERRRIVPMTLATFVESMGQTPQSLATAVNGEFVARAARTGRQLKPGDEIFTFQPITGG